MATAQEIITSALVHTGAYGAGQTPSPEILAAGLVRLKSLIGQYQNENAYTYGVKIQTFTIGSSKVTYTLGPSAADFTVTPRPAQIMQINLLLAPQFTTRIPLDMLTADEWGQRRQRSLAGLPGQVFPNPVAPNWELWFYPFPSDVTNQIEVIMTNPVASLSALGDVLVAPEGYEGNLVAILAEMMGPIVHLPVSLDVRDQARRARSNMVTLNSKSTPIRTSMTVSGGGTTYFNWRDGSIVTGPGRF